MNRIAKILTMAWAIGFLAFSFLLPMNFLFNPTSAIEENSSSEEDWPCIRISNVGFNVSWEAIRAITDNNGIIYILWNEYSYVKNETNLYFCTYNGTFSEPELILHMQNTSLWDFRIPFDTVFDSLNRLHIVYNLRTYENQFCHQYYFNGVWSTPILLDSIGQFSLLADNSENVYLFGTSQRENNLSANIYCKIFSGNTWSEEEKLTNYPDVYWITQRCTDLTASINKASGQIFIGYTYEFRQLGEEDNGTDITAFRYLYYEGKNWINKEYKRQLCYQAHAAFDDTGKVHLIYNNGSSSDGYYYNYVTYKKNKWSLEEHIQIFTVDDPEGRSEPAIYDMKILGSAIFIAFANRDLITDLDINLLHYNSSKIWTQIPINKNDTIFTSMPMIAVNENGTVVVAHLAYTGNFNLLASNQNSFFKYKPTKVFPGFSFEIIIMSLLLMFPIVIKRKKNV